ncbi:YciI family protein [soil metagenome]
MKFLVLMTETDPSAWETASEEQRAAVFAAHEAFDREVRRRGTMLAGEALAGSETATTLRAVNGQQIVTDGPFAETAEQIGGFYLMDVPDLDAAVDLCRLLPVGYTTEIRPTLEIEGDDPGAD